MLKVVWSGYFREKGRLKQKVMQSFTDVNVPCEVWVWAAETPEEVGTCVKRVNHSRLKQVRMTLSKDKDSNSKQVVAT